MPFPLIAWLIGTAVAGTGVSATNSILAGRAAKRAGEAQREAADSYAALQDENAAWLDRQSADVLAIGEAQVARFYDELRVLVGAQRAGFAAFNVDVSAGSALDVQADAERLAELDITTLRTNAQRAALGLRVEATDLRQRAVVARRTGQYAEAAGRSAATQATLGAFSTVLGSTASLLQLRYGWRTPTPAPATGGY